MLIKHDDKYYWKEIESDYSIAPIKYDLEKAYCDLARTMIGEYVCFNFSEDDLALTKDSK